MISETKKQVLDYFARGRRFYKLMQFQEGLKMFQKALELDPDDGPSKIYVARCESYIAEPPPEDWDGVYVMKTK